MKKILHIVATPRQKESRTLEVTQAFLGAFKSKNPDWETDELNLYKENLPELTLKRIDGKYLLLGGNDLSGELKQAWKGIVSAIERFSAADIYLLSVPMWNFGIPYRLKHYIDVILQPKYLFAYTANGPVGLLKDKKMVVITSRGGDYSSAAAKGFDLQEPYLRTAFGFAGIHEITFIHAQPMDALGPEVQREKIKDAQRLAKETALRL
jgi:FMN-dependent NADH-azoreductase